MTRRFQGLNQTAQASPDEFPDGMYLALVEKAQYRWDIRKPFYLLRLAVLGPVELQGRILSGRLSCTHKALWKLAWFLRDFGYDQELLSRDEVDERALLGLRGVVKISRTVVNGTALVNFDGFAPASQWVALAPPLYAGSFCAEAAR
jgi:hypothetical protein